MLEFGLDPDIVRNTDTSKGNCRLSVNPKDEVLKMVKLWKLALVGAVASAASGQALAQSAPRHSPEYGSKNFDNNTFGGTASYGQYFTDNVLLSARQSLGFGFVDNGTDTWNGSSVVGVDYVFGSGRFRPFVGVFVGAVYGKNVDFDGVAGAEGGLKYYANKTTFVQLAASYGPTFTDGFSDGNFQYTLGMGLNF